MNDASSSYSLGQTVRTPEGVGTIVRIDDYGKFRIFVRTPCGNANPYSADEIEHDSEQSASRSWTARAIDSAVIIPQKYGSDYFGKCELCGSHMATAYLGKFYRYIKHPDGGTSAPWTSKYGHEQCLKKFVADWNAANMPRND